MIVNNELTTANDNASNFSMKQSAHAFKILTTSLYSNKHKAVLREYFANAYDAILEASKTDPVRICLPTTDEPTLVISDTGVGMDKDQLTKLYSTFFDSTKQHSNDTIGGFGLGSKSAFAISNEFFVTSTKDNYFVTVKAFLDKGMPKLSIINEGPSTSPTGTTVSIPIFNETDQTRLYEQSIDLFVYSPIPPIVTLGTTESVNIKTNPSHNVYHNMYFTTGWRKFDQAVIGLFSYSIPESLQNRIEQNTDYQQLYSKFRKVTDQTCLNFVLPLGALELSPSRETIEDTEENAEVLLTIIEAALTKFIKDVDSYLDPTYNFLKSFVATDLSNYIDYQNKLEEFKKLVPINIISSIDKKLYNTDFTNDPVSTTLHTNLSQSPWFTIDRHNSLVRLNYVFNYNKWYYAYDLNKVNVKKLNTSRKSPAVVPVGIKEPDKKIYLVNTKGANVTRYYKQVSKTLNYNNETIDIENIYILDDLVDYAKVSAMFEGIAVEIPPSYFDIKPIRNTTTVVRTPKSDIKTFFVEFDSTNNFSGELTLDFYSTPLPTNTSIILIQYSSTVRTSWWQNIPALVYSPTPVLVLKEIRSGEHKTKRFTSFVKDLDVEYIDNSDSPDYCTTVQKYFKSDSKHLAAFFKLTNTLANPQIAYDEPEKLSKLGLYHFVSTKTEMKYARKLLPKEVYITMFKHIWNMYKLNSNISSIIKDLYYNYKYSNLLIGMPCTYNRFDINNCQPLAILTRSYSTNDIYDWVLSQPTAIDEIKACINPQLGV